MAIEYTAPESRNTEVPSALSSTPESPLSLTPTPETIPVIDAMDECTWKKLKDTGGAVDADNIDLGPDF